MELGALAFLLKQAIILGPPPAPPPDEWIAEERLRISELPEGSEQQMLAGENLEEELKPKQGPPAVCSSSNCVLMALSTNDTETCTFLLRLLTRPHTQAHHFRLVVVC